MDEKPVTTGNSLKILIVEDDQFLQKILMTKFLKEGFDARGAVDGEEALKAVADDLPMIILLDLIMPKMNGFEVLAELRRDPATKNVPVVVMSNLAQEEDIVRARSLGADDFMVKANFSIHEVVQRVKETYAKSVG